jgi:hypothetical protein
MCSLKNDVPKNIGSLDIQKVLETKKCTKIAISIHPTPHHRKGQRELTAEMVL